MKPVLTSNDKRAGRSALVIHFKKTNIYYNFVQRISDFEVYKKVFGGVRGQVDNFVYERIARRIWRGVIG